MIASALAITLNLSMPVGMNVDIANCANQALATNRLSEQSARHIHVGMQIRIDGSRVTISRRDTLWGLCEAAIDSRMKATSANLVQSERITVQLGTLARSSRAKAYFIRLPASMKHP